MRTVNLIIAIVLIVLLALFAVQNLQSVTVSFLSFSLTAPFALVAIGIYVLGMLTGSTLFGALRRSFRDRQGS
ncbi:LapA family protein [Acuticoccus mangrovi]|uniref:Lipopolysaccharide assembly protein A domain-containing protein n=1 Tax=Acuticoccus mangrovi TaxID=2796142 RepID=A0A934MEX4_9HYPH|nr:hypothetical protein [Acuticoccus mangrovi]MBJ3774853.1 hypothetical protein [Acuticoccus mangrovi]